MERFVIAMGEASSLRFSSSRCLLHISPLLGRRHTVITSRLGTQGYP